MRHLKIIIGFVAWFAPALLLVISCYNPDDYKNISADGVINIISSDTTVEGDGANEATIKVRISDKAVPSKRKVVIKSTSGSFKGGKGDSVVVTADDKFVATAKLAGTSVGTATVSARILTAKAPSSMKVTFTKVFPDKVTVSVDSFQIRNTYKSEVTITATLARGSKGVASASQTVTFTAVDSVGNPRGAFLNNINTASSGADGKARIRYSAGEANLKGYLTLRATAVIDASGTTTSGTTRIFLSKN